jgi:hypothetical protein
MNNQVKKMFAEKFNKEENLQKIMQKVKPKKLNILKYAFMPICLIILGIIFINKPAKKSYKQSVLSNSVYINEIKMSDTLADLDIKTVVYKDNIINDYTNNLDKKYSFIDKIKLPNDINFTSISLVYVKENKEDKTYDKLHDYILKYENNTLNKNIIIAFNEGETKPLRDYYIKNDNLKVSKIKDTDLYIGKQNNMYIVTFTYQEKNFDIETINIEEKELLELLNSIIN